MTDKQMKLNQFIWKVSDIARGRYNLGTASDLLVIYFLKFVSDNQGVLGVQLGSLQNFNVISRSFARETNKQDLIILCREIEAQLNIGKFGISNHLARLLDSITDLEYLSQLLHYFTEEDFTDISQESLLASSLLDYIAQKSGQDIGSTTLGSIASLMVCIGDVENRQIVWDGYCGYGRTLVEIVKKNPNIEIYANEINANTAMSAAMFQIMCFNKHCNIQCANSILTDDNGMRNKIDVIISAPPFGMSLQQEEMEAIYRNDDIPYPESLSKRGDLFFVQQAISKLSPDGVAVIQLPMGSLFQSGKVGELRRKLVENGHIKAVIQLPSGCVAGTAIPTCILVATPSQCNKEIVLINASSDLFSENISKISRSNVELTDEGIQNIKTFIDNRTQLDGVSVSVSLEQIADKDFLLTPDAYTAPKVDLKKSYIPLEELLKKDRVLFSNLDAVTNELFNQLNAIRDRRM